MSKSEFSLQNIRFTMDGGVSKKQYTFSAVSIDGAKEVALLDEEGFIPVSDWFGTTSAGDMLDQVLPVASLRFFAYACDAASRYATNN